MFIQQGHVQHIYRLLNSRVLIAVDGLTRKRFAESHSSFNPA